MKKTRYFAATITALVLAGCSGTPSPEDLKNDPKLMEKINAECRKLGPQAMNEEKCINVLKAMALKSKERLESLKRKQK